MKKVIIKTENLSKRFGVGVNILKNISLEVYEKDFTIIMGSSGSGKSTLLYAISSMDKATGGDIFLMGKNVGTMEDKEIDQLRRKDISFIFQNMNLIPDMTAFENVTYPAYQVMPKTEANTKANKLLERFGLMGEKAKYPSEMSGGQQQRVAIARALVKSPKIIYGDEPTGSLNSSAGTQVLNLMTQLNEEGQTIVMVTHDIKACARGNRLLFLSDGRIAGDLHLGKYDSSRQQSREKTIFTFLEEHNW